LRKVLLLTALCMALALVLSGPVMAQSASADPCPDPDFPRETPDGCQASDLPDVEFGNSASSSASASSAALEGIPQDCDNFASQFAAQQFYDFNATPEQQAAFDPDGNGFACDGGEIEFGGDDASASTSASASASASVSVLPETGGPVSVMALVPLVLLVGTGILALRIVRRS